MAVTTYNFAPWNTDYAYTKWDVVYGVNASDSRYFYSLTDNNNNNRPLAFFSYTPTSSTRTDNVNRLYFTQTGTAYFNQGSIVEIANITPDSSICYTGVVLAGGPGYVDYLNPGLNVTNSIIGGTIRAPIHPNWTTGWFWIPSYGSDVTQGQLVYRTPLGEGYSQRMNPVINSNSLAWNMTFENRTDKETSSMLNFLQDKGGVIPTPMPFPVGNLYNNPNLRYIFGPPRQGLSAYNINSTTVTAQQVFDIP